MSLPSVPHTPGNPNIMHPNKFIVTFASLPNIEYWVQSANLPGLSLGEAPRQTPFIDLYSPGDKLIINPFSFTFLVDEDLFGWKEIYTWMRGMTFPRDFTEYRDLNKRPGTFGAVMPQFSDASLTILDSKQNPHIRVKFFNCFPITLTDLLFSATSTPDDPVTADATYRFDLYEVNTLQ